MPSKRRMSSTWLIQFPWSTKKKTFKILLSLKWNW